MELHSSADAIAGAGALAQPVALAQPASVETVALTEPASTLPPAVPPMLRTPMAPERWGRVGPVSWMLRRLFGLDPRLPDIEGPAHGAGRRRRFVLLTLSLLPALYATYVLDGLLPNVVTANETVDLAIAWGETALLIVFALLTCWLAAGFWTAILGFFVLVIGGDRQLISRSAKADVISPQARTAIVMPICNEDVRACIRRLTRHLRIGAACRCARPFRLLRAVGHQRTPTRASPSWMRGTRCAKSSVRSRGCSIGIAARRVKRKSGNIDDFCRRWGAKLSVHGRARRRQCDELANA